MKQPLTIRQSLKNVVKAWETLPGGRDYSPKQVGIWLQETMKPAMDEARRSLNLPIPSKPRHMPYDE